MTKVIVFDAVLIVFAAIFGDCPARKAGNLAPIQLIIVLGVWALVLANAFAIAVAIRDGSVILVCAATATFAIALISFLRDDAASVHALDDAGRDDYR